MTNKESVASSFYKALKSFGAALPVLLGVILLIGLFKTYITLELISSVFTGNLFRIRLVLIYLCIGLIAGLMSGIFGIGGGSIRIPLLNFAGLPLINAFGINLFVIPFSSLMGAVTHRKNIDKKIVVYIIIGGTLGSITRAFLVGLISNIVLSILFVITAIITVMAIYLDRIGSILSEKINPNRYNIMGFSFF